MALLRSLLIGALAGFLVLPFVVFSEEHRMPVHEAAAAILCGVIAAIGVAVRRWYPLSRRKWLTKVVRTGALILPIIMVAVGWRVLVGTNTGAVLLLAILSAVIGWDAGGVLRHLDGQPGEAPRAPHREIMARFMTGACLLFAAAGASEVKAHAQVVPVPPVPAVQDAVAYLGYTLTGLLLIGYVRFAFLSRHWSMRQAVVGIRVRGRLVVQTVLLVLGAAGAYLTVAVAMAGGAFDPLFTVVGKFIASGPHLRNSKGQPVIDNPIVICAHEICHKLGGAGGGKGHRPSHPVNMVHLALDVLAVVVLLAVVLYLSRHWLRTYVTPLVTRLLRMMQRLLHRYGGPVIAAWTGGAAGRTVEGPSGWKRMIPRLLSPRDRILYDYQQLLWRAERRGMPRLTGQTPAEFGAALVPILGDAGSEVRGITTMVVRARYSPHPAEEQDATEVHAAWLRVRAVLRRARWWGQTGE